MIGKRKKFDIAIVSRDGSREHLRISTRQAVLGFFLLFVLPLCATGLLAYHYYLKPSAAPSVVKLEKTLDTRLDYLVDEMIRVRNYERELKTRAQFLDAILKDTEQFDFKQPETPLEEIESGLGVGGGDDASRALVNDFLPMARRVPQGDSSKGLLGALDTQLELLRTLPIGIPVQGRISSRYGWRRSPFSRRKHMHRGLDIAVDHRSSVSATGDGKVIRAGYKGGYGRTVIVDHGNGVTTMYSHLSRIRVKRGQKVCRGQQIGLVGSTGRSTGPHLHYEVKVNGKAKDPAVFVQMAEFLSLLRG